MTSPFSSFITELRRRRVFRVAAVYGGVAFVITEVVSNVFPALDIPDWAQSFMVVLIIIGFPIAIGFAWAFDITDEGIVRVTKHTAPSTTRPLIGNTALGDRGIVSDTGCSVELVAEGARSTICL